MHTCRYSIIPVVEKEVCSSCGKKLDDAPRYSQIMKIYVRTGVNGKETCYLALGLGVPKCKKCDSKVNRTIKITSNVISYLVAIPLILVSISLSVLCDFNMIGIAILIGVCMWLFIDIMGRLYKWVENKILDRHGKYLVQPVYDILSTGVWSNSENNTWLCEDYDMGKLQWDLDVVCGDGAFCILDDREGKIVDYHDPEIMERIYFDSKKYVYDDD